MTAGLIVQSVPIVAVPTLAALPSVLPEVLLVQLGIPAAGQTRVLGAPGKEQLGNHLAFGDVNADGLADLLAGAHWGSEGGRNNVGRAYVLFGRQPWAEELDLTTVRDRVWSFTGEGKEPRLGVSIASGDVSGDGIDDVAIGALLADPFGQANGGAIYIMHGAATAGGEVDFLNASPDTLIAGRSDPSGSDQLGTDVVIADLNADGHGDLVAAAALRDGFHGAVFGWWGPLRRGVFNLQDRAPDWSLVGDQDGMFLGTTLATAELNGKPGAELIVGAFEGHVALGAPAGSGAVYVFDAATLLPGGERPLGDARHVITGPSGTAISGAQRFGTCSCHGQPLAVDDFDHDGIDDIAIGAPLAEGRYGAVAVVRGPLPDGHMDLVEGAHAANVTWILGAAREDSTGWAVASGDLDGDGAADLLIGAPGASVPAAPSTVGVVYGLRGPLAFGRVLSATLEASLIAHGGAASDGDGGVSIGLHDTNGDGFDDLHIGLPDSDPKGRSSVGAIFRLSGPVLEPPAAPTPVPTASATITPSPTPSATATRIPSPSATGGPTRRTATRTPEATLPPGTDATPEPTSTADPLPDPTLTSALTPGTPALTPRRIHLPLALRGR